MDAMLGGRGGGVCGETAFGFSCRPDQKEERMEEALELVCGATAHLRRRLRAMELKMGRTRERALAAAGVLSRQAARVERVHGKMAAFERFESKMAALEPLDCKMAAVERLDCKMAAVERLDCKMAAVERLECKMAAVERLECKMETSGASDDDSDYDDLSRLSVASSSGDEYPNCPRCRTSSSSFSVDSGSSCASSFFAIDDVDSQSSCLDSTSQTVPLLLEENASLARAVLTRHLCGLQLDSSSLSSKASANDPIPKASLLDSSAYITPNVSKKPMTSVVSSFSRFCDHIFDPSSFSSTASAALPNQESSRSYSTIHTAPISDVNKISSVNSAIHRLCKLLSDSSSGLSTTAVDIPISKARSDSISQTTPSVSAKPYSARSSFSRHTSGDLWDSSTPSSTATTTYQNQDAPRLDCTFQTMPVIEKRSDSASSSCSRRLCGHNVNSSSMLFTAGNTFSNTAQKTSVISDKHTHPTPTSLSRRLCKHVMDSLSALATIDAAFPNQESIRLDSNTRTPTFSDATQKLTTVTRLCNHLSDLLGSAKTVDTCTWVPEMSLLNPSSEVPHISEKRISSFHSFSRDISSSFPDSVSISDKHICSANSSLSSSRRKILRSAAAIASTPFVLSVEPISRSTRSSNVQVDTDGLHQCSEKSPPATFTSSRPCGIACKPTPCGYSGCFSGLTHTSACTQTDDSPVAESHECSMQAPQNIVPFTSCNDNSEAEKFHKFESISMCSSSVVCHCPSTAGTQKSLSGCHSPGMVSQSTSCTTFPVTNIASSSGFYDWENHSQLSSVSCYDDTSQFSFSSEPLTQVVWVPSPSNPFIYYCVPLINNTFYTLSDHKYAIDTPTITPDSPCSASKPQSYFRNCDFTPPVPSAMNESKSSESRAVSYTPNPTQTTPAKSASVVPNSCTTCVSKPLSVLSRTEPPTFTPDESISSSVPNSSPLAINAASPNSISDNRQSVIQANDCLLSSPKPPSGSEPIARECSTEANGQCTSRVQKSKSSCTLLSSCVAPRPTSSGLPVKVTQSYSSNFGSSKHSSDSKIHSTNTSTPSSSQSTTVAHISQPLEEVSTSAASVTKNIQDSTSDEPSICSPDVSLSISQPSSHTPSLHDTSCISLVSKSHSSNLHSTPPVTLCGSASTPFDDVITAAKCSLPFSTTPDIINTNRRQKFSSESIALIPRVSSAVESREVTSHVISRLSSPRIPPAPPPTPENHVFGSEEVNRGFVAHVHKTESKTMIRICACKAPSTCSISQPPADGIFLDETSKHTSNVRQFSSKTVILPKNVIRPHLPYIESPVSRRLSGCVSIKEGNRPFSGHPLRKGISDSTFVIESPKSVNRPCVSSSPSPNQRPNSTSIRTGGDTPSPLSVHKRVSETTFVVDTPKRIVRPSVSCDDSKLIRRSVKFDIPPPSRMARRGALTKPHSFASLTDLPCRARVSLPLVRTTSVLRKERPAPVARVARSRSAEVKLGRRLLKAAQEGRAPAVRKLLGEGADVNFTFATKWTALHRAVKMGHEDVVCALLDGGANVEAKTTYDFTALHIAAYYDRTGLCLARLIDAGSDLRSRNRSGKTALHYASEVGNKMAVRALVVAGADTCSLDDDGKTPYDVAKVDDVRGLLACAGDGQKGARFG